MWNCCFYRKRPVSRLDDSTDSERDHKSTILAVEILIIYISSAIIEFETTAISLHSQNIYLQHPKRRADVTCQQLHVQITVLNTLYTSVLVLSIDLQTFIFTLSVILNFSLFAMYVII